MRTRKICMIGDFGVGKTSLVARFVRSEFSDRYLTTVGIKVDTKIVELANGESVKLVLWDVAGTDALPSVAKAYLQHAAGYLLVADGTRPNTLDTAIGLQAQVEQLIGVVPFSVLLNKHDLTDAWRLTSDATGVLGSRDWSWCESSARSGAGVEQAFRRLGERMLGVDL